MFLTRKDVEEIAIKAFASQRETMLAEILEGVQASIAEIDTNSSAEAIQTAVTTAVATAVDTRLLAIEARVAEFAGAPGEQNQEPTPTVDPTREDSASELDTLNKFMAENKHDTAACVNALAKFNQQS
jgi:hypothetical protein